MYLGNAPENRFFSVQRPERYDNDDFFIDENDPNNFGGILCRGLQPAQMVLDVGCGTGRLSKYLHKEHQCRMIGVEMDPERAKIAAESGVFEQLFNEDINASPVFDENIAPESLDAIILSDVLEHVVDPTGALKLLAGKLKRNGVIRVSVPNIAHADIICNLLKGSFNYAETGILDNTHLKFFTRRSFAEWIEQFNLEAGVGYHFDCRFLGSTICYGSYIEQLFKENDGVWREFFEKYPEHLSLRLLFELRKIEVGSETLGLLTELERKECGIFQELTEKLEAGAMLKRQISENANLLWANNQLVDSNRNLVNKMNAIEDHDRLVIASQQKVCEAKQEVYDLKYELYEAEEALKQAELLLEGAEERSKSYSEELNFQRNKNSSLSTDKTNLEAELSELKSAYDEIVASEGKLRDELGRMKKHWLWRLGDSLKLWRDIKSDDDKI